MTRQISWRVSKRDLALVAKIVDRAEAIYGEINRLNLMMDLEATHANGCRMDFARLLAADEFNFMHDVSGIARHIDRTTGKLRNHFLPRFHAPRQIRRRKAQVA